MSLASAIVATLERWAHAELALNSLRAGIVRARAAGKLDLANKLSEFLHWAECDYDASWLDRMFCGVPPLKEAARADGGYRQYAPVLQRMVEMLGAKDSPYTFGMALAKAAADCRIPVPRHMEEPLLTAAFQIISSGRLSGAPDA